MNAVLTFELLQKLRLDFSEKAVDGSLVLQLDSADTHGRFQLQILSSGLSHFFRWLALRRFWSMPCVSSMFPQWILSDF